MAATILYVEDNPDHAELVMEVFAENGDAPVWHVNDGVEALAYLDSHPAPKLILLDLRLPKLGGLAVLERVKATEGWKHIPVVVLTTSAAGDDLARAYARGANAYVVKPTQFERFEALLMDLQSFWVSWNHPLATG